MPSLPSKGVLYLIAAIASLLFTYGGYEYLIHKGENIANQTVATNQLKTEVKDRKADEKIDKATPYGADADVVIKWLYEHAIAN